MRRFLLLCVAVGMTVASFAAFTLTKPAKPTPLKASEMYLPLGKGGELVSLMDLSRMKIKEYQQLTGKKMKLFEKIGFKAAQKQLKNSINRDGTFNSKKMERYLKKSSMVGEGFHIGGFALGFLLGLIGVLIAYLINDDLKSTRVKWAWIGLAAWIVILILLLVV